MDVLTERVEIAFEQSSEVSDSFASDWLMPHLHYTVVEQRFVVIKVARVAVEDVAEEGRPRAPSC